MENCDEKRSRRRSRLARGLVARSHSTKRKTKIVLARAIDAARFPLVNTPNANNSAARDAGQRTQITVRDRTGNIISPGDPDYDMMKAKQESRERRACAHIGLLATPACEGMAAETRQN